MRDRAWRLKRKAEAYEHELELKELSKNKDKKHRLTKQRALELDEQSILDSSDD